MWNFRKTQWRIRYIKHFWKKLFSTKSRNLYRIKWCVNSSAWGVFQNVKESMWIVILFLTINICPVVQANLWTVNSRGEIGNILKILQKSSRNHYSARTTLRKRLYVDIDHILCNIRGLFKKYREFCIFSKSIHFFMNIYFIPFRVISIRNYTLMQTFFPILEAFQKIIFCDLVQLLLRCRLYLINRGIASSFHVPL